MKPTLRSATVVFLAIATAAPAALTQDVVLSEIRADGAECWVELHNRGTATVNLSTWSLYYATHTTGMPQNYWWPFQLGTSIEPDAYLRVHWFLNASGGVPAGEYWTGTSAYGYLFALGGEQLRADNGAFALITSQIGTQMGTAANIEDWVSWGSNNFLRESLAVQNGVWTAGVHTPSIPAGQSLARNEAQIGVAATTEQQWFLDPTPTPMGPNVQGVAVISYGDACTVPGHHLVGQPHLTTSSLPLIGNAQFGWNVDNTTGFYGEVMLLAFGTAPKPQGQPTWLPQFPGMTCREAVDPASVIGCLLVPTHVMQTQVPMSLANLPLALAGVQLHAEALVFDWLPNAYPPFQGVSNALFVTFGQ